jgi:hypothetical protein
MYVSVTTGIVYDEIIKFEIIKFEINTSLETASTGKVSYHCNT